VDKGLQVYRKLQFKNIFSDTAGVTHKLAGTPTAPWVLNWPANPPGTQQALTLDAAGNVTYQSLGGGGTVLSVGLSLPAIFSVAGSPITTSGTLAATLTTQGVNSVFAGPSSGGAAAPAFRSLVANDVPSLPSSKISDLTPVVQALIDSSVTALYRNKGNADASAASVSLAVGTSTFINGDMYRVTVGGSTAFGFQLNVGDHVWYNGSSWNKIDNTDPTVGGTTNRISVTPTGDTAFTVDIASNYAGQASITTVGTIATGTWSGDAIALNKGGTGATTAAAARTALGVPGKFPGLFTNATLVAGVLSVAHGLGNLAPVFVVTDQNGFTYVPDNVRATDANTLSVDLTTFGTITGTHNYTVIG
jgi:hypothetical protein